MIADEFPRATLLYIYVQCVDDHDTREVRRNNTKWTEMSSSSFLFPSNISAKIKYTLLNVDRIIRPVAVHHFPSTTISRRKATPGLIQSKLKQDYSNGSTEIKRKKKQKKKSRERFLMNFTVGFLYYNLFIARRSQNKALICSAWLSRTLILLDVVLRSEIFHVRF